MIGLNASVGESTAKAVAVVYPTPRILYEACQTHGPDLLENIQVLHQKKNNPLPFSQLPLVCCTHLNFIFDEPKPKQKTLGHQGIKSPCSHWSRHQCSNS